MTTIPRHEVAAPTPLRDALERVQWAIQEGSPDSSAAPRAVFRMFERLVEEFERLHAAPRTPSSDPPDDDRGNLGSSEALPFRQRDRVLALLRDARVEWDERWTYDRTNGTLGYKGLIAHVMPVHGHEYDHGAGELLAAAPELAHALIQLAGMLAHERAARASQTAAWAEEWQRLTTERDAAVQAVAQLRAVADHHLQAIRAAALALDAQNLNLPHEALDHLLKARTALHAVFPPSPDAPAETP